MQTMLHRLNAWAKSSPNALAQRHRVWGQKDAPWTDISVQQYANNVLYVAAFLESKGFKQGDIATIYSYNCPQWPTMELGAILAHGMNAGIYPNSIAKEVLYILNHTECKVLSVQDKKYFNKLGGESVLPATIQYLIVFDNDTSFHPKAISYASVLQEGKRLIEKSGKTFDDYLKPIKATDGAYIIYTSGTTGEPKGAILSHDNLAFASDATIEHWSLPKGQGHLFSFLPMCHVAEQLHSVGVGITNQYPVTYCTSMEKLLVEIVEVQPTLLLCVPRVWEKVMEGVESKLAKAQGIQKVLANWALQVGGRVAAKNFSGKSLSPIDMVEHALAYKLVISKIRKNVGMLNVQKAASGAAALPGHVSKWYRALGIEILEDFGQTETSGVLCMTKPGMDALGSVGVPTTGTEFRLAEDGEVLTRGRHVFIGYLKNPDATKATVDENGWVRTGDLAVIDEKGLVRIRGRKKEVMKTSGGKMIAPLPIEDKIKQSSMVSQVCMVGDGRKYFTALITLTEELTVSAKSEGKVIRDVEIVQRVKAHVDTVNRELASYEKIKYFAVLARDFSVDTGEMTPTMKMKRSVIESAYRDVIDSMYSDAD